MKQEYKNGVWPVMITPFTEDNRVDYPSLERLINWYIEAGVAGLFAVCQSSEMFFLSLEERLEIARFTKKIAGDRVSVIASGHISDRFEDQVEEINAMAKTGVDAAVLISNRIALEEESDEVWIQNANRLLAEIPSHVPLGFYECPHPYKRIISPKMLRWCISTDRFYFIKDTSCSIDNIKEKLALLKGSQIKLFNANTTTLLESLELGAAGFSGVMANFHPELYVTLCRDFSRENLEDLSSFLAISSLIERQVYPVNAKYFLQTQGIVDGVFTRVKDENLLGATQKLEVESLTRLTEIMKKCLVPLL